MIYPDLYALLHSEPEAKRHFDALSAYTREQISAQASNVNSLDRLKDLSENVPRGDA